MRILDYIFFILFVLILLLSLIITDFLLPLIKIINCYGGFITLLSVAIVIIIFFLNKHSDHSKERRRQEQIVKNLSFELDEIKEDSKRYDDSFFNPNVDGFPFYKIKQINRNYYLTEFDDVAFGMGEYNIKEKILVIYDKIELINNYIGYILSDYNKFLSRQKKENFNPMTSTAFLKNSVILHYWKNNVKIVKSHLDKILNEVIENLPKKYLS